VDIVSFIESLMPSVKPPNKSHYYYPSILQQIHLFLLFISTSASPTCLGEYQQCNTTFDCVLDPSFCGTCPPFQFLCPDTRTCASTAEVIITTCPLSPPLYNWKLSNNERVAQTLPLLTLTEKASLITMVSAGVPRLSIPAYNFWVEAQHGAGMSDTVPASSGPQTSALAASFSPDLMRQMANMAAVEVRARHNIAVASGDRTSNQHSLTAFSPEMNLVRFPLWGRVQESIGGEDPLLIARLSGAFVSGLQQGDAGDRLHLVSACCKDFPIYDIEFNREVSNITLTARDLAETYLPPFIGCVASSNAAAVMLTYNGVQLPGQEEARSAVANEGVLQLLRNDPSNTSSQGFGWNGLAMSDCDAIWDLVTRRSEQPDAMHAAASALTAGTDLELNILPFGCGGNLFYAYSSAPDAINAGLMSNATLDAAVTRVLTMRSRLGVFDPPTTSPYNTIGQESILSAAHIALTRTLASSSVVLLQNRNNTLPLNPVTLKRLALIGPTIDFGAALLGDYSDLSAPSVSLAEAAEEMFQGVELAVANGCITTACPDQSGFIEAAIAAYNADVVILQLGLCSDACDGSSARGPAQEKEGSDRESISLPGNQTELAISVRSVMPKESPLICVLIHGGILDVDPLLSVCSAILSASYPGMQGGPGIIDVLLGTVAPAGKTPLTWYSSSGVTALAPANDTNMYSLNGTGRTYRFQDVQSAPPVQFPFGYGLSYTQWTYSNLTILPPSSAAEPLDPCTTLSLTVLLCNVGNIDSDQVTQVYLSTPDGIFPSPRIRLIEFNRVFVYANECSSLSFSIPPPAWMASSDEGELFTQPGRLIISVGGGQPDFDPNVVQSTAYLASSRLLSQCGGSGGAFPLLKDYYSN
jgi:beta-glucosidase